MTENLTRTVDFTPVRAQDDGDGLTLEGYGAVFNTPTRIDSWEGFFDEVIAPGAFRKTLSDKGPKGVRLQFDHGTHPLIGSIPIGVIQELREDARGLYVKARLSDNWLVEPVRDAIRDGSVQGMSFRFRVIQELPLDESSDVPLRTLTEIELAEVGPVVWPAYEETSVGVRAREIASQLMDPEQRAEIARALLAGTSQEAAVPGTSDEAAVTDEPAPATRRTTKDAMQAVRRLDLITQSRKEAA